MHTRVVQYGMPWVTGGIMYSIGRGCNGVSYAFLQCGYNRGFTLSGGCMQNSFCRFGKISSGFFNQAFLQYGCGRVFYLIPGMYAGLVLQIWENLVGVWQSCILINLA